MSAKTSAIIVLALGVGLCSSAHAAASSVLMDALVTSSTALGLNNNSGAESFVTNSTGLVGDIELYLAEAASTTSGSIVITINSTTSGKPGAVVDTIQTLAESQIPTGAGTLFDFDNISLATALSPNTEYWIMVGKGAGSGVINTQTFTTPAANLIVGIASSGSAAGDTAYSLNGGSALTSKMITDCVSADNSCDASNPALAQYTFNESTNTPEPASVAIIGTALAGMGWIRRRRAKKA